VSDRNVLSDRAFSEDEIFVRMNREVIPALRNAATRLTSFGFPVAVANLSDRAMTPENWQAMVRRELMPCLASLIQQANDANGSQAITAIGQRTPLTVPGLVHWMNRIAGPKLRTAVRVVDDIG